MNTSFRLLYATLLGGILSGSALAQSTPIITMDKVMTAEEVKATGVDTLTSAQRSALDQWLTKYTMMVIKLAQHSEESAPSPSTARPAPRSYLGSGGGHWVKSKANNGGLIILEDGSMWEINSFDRLDTALWLPITNIVVLEASQPIGDYKYVLVNKDDGEKALAKFLGRE